MPDQSPLLTGNHGRICPGQCNKLKALMLSHAVLTLILTGGILQLIGSQYINSYINIYTHSQKDKKQLQDSHTDRSTNKSGKKNSDSGVDNENKIGDIYLFSEEENANKQCWLSSIKDMLGCGHIGHVFSANMICHQKNDGSISESRQDIVFKVRFNRTHKGDHTEIDQFISEDETKIKKRDELFKLLLSNTTNMQRHFHLPFGMVSVPPIVLWEAASKYNEECHFGSILGTKATKKAQKRGLSPAPVLGAVMEHAGLEELELDPTKLVSLDDQRRVVRDLVCMFQHMFERNVVHQDIRYRHFFYDGEHVSLIDFTHVDILLPAWGKIKTRKKTLMQKAQLFQLMALIKHVCTKNLDHYLKYRLHTADVKDPKLDMVPFTQNWSLALKQCNFVNEPTPTPFLFDKNVTTAEAYQVLSHWTGGCSN